MSCPSSCIALTGASFRQELRDTNALIALDTAKSMGVQIFYQDRGPDAYIQLWAIPGNQIRREEFDGQLVEDITTITFTIPRQMGCTCGCNGCCLVGEVGHTAVLFFPPPMPRRPGTDEPSINAKIKYENFDWAVKTWECDAVEAVWAVHCEYHHPRGTEIH